MPKLRNLHLIEISSCIHTGKVNKKATIDDKLTKGSDGWYTPSIQSGGLAFLFNKILECDKNDDIVFVADRPPTKKREYFPDYKMHRPGDDSVSIQKELAEEILEDCGYLVIYEEGYEADDVVYTLAEKYASEYKNVLVHTDDSDLFIVVKDNVHCVPVRSTGIFVTQSNYENVAQKNYKTPFNSLSFSKVLYGDLKSDNVPPLAKNIQDKLIRMYWNETHFPFMRNRDFMRAAIEATAPEALLQFEVIYPLFVEEAGIGLVPEPDWSTVKAWASVVGNSKFGKPPTIPKPIKAKVAKWFEKGYGD